MNKIYCYARVSTEEQKLDRQIASFKEFEPYTLYTDKDSGKNHVCFERYTTIWFR